MGHGHWYDANGERVRVVAASDVAGPPDKGSRRPMRSTEKMQRQSGRTSTVDIQEGWWLVREDPEEPRKPGGCRCGQSTCRHCRTGRGREESRSSGYLADEGAI